MQDNSRVAVTGLGINCALGDGTDNVWTAVREGRSGVRLTQRLNVDSLSCHYSAEFDEQRPPVKRPKGRLDRATRLALCATQEALDSSGLELAGYDPYRVGLAMGTSVGGLDEGEKFHWELLRDGPRATGRPICWCTRCTPRPTRSASRTG